MDEIHREKNSLAIARALIRSMSASEVLANFDFAFKQYYKLRLELIARLVKLYIADETNVKYLRQLIDTLFEKESLTPSAKRRVLDDTICAGSAGNGILASRNKRQCG